MKNAGLTSGKFSRILPPFYLALTTCLTSLFSPDWAFAKSIELGNMGDNSTKISQSGTSDLKDRVTALSAGIISALNDVSVNGDFDASARKHKIEGVNINPILKKIERRKFAHNFRKSIGRSHKNFKSQFSVLNIREQGDEFRFRSLLKLN
jgi:hypothetical protein